MAPRCKCQENPSVGNLSSPLKRHPKFYSVLSNVFKLNPRMILTQIGNIAKLVNDVYVVIDRTLKRKATEKLEEELKNQQRVEIYERLMENPLLHGANSNLVDINCFIQGAEPVQTARHYASFLWNWKMHCEAKKYHKIVEYIQRSLFLVLKYMDEKDVDVIKTVIVYYFTKYFNCIECIKNPAHIKAYLKDQMFSNPKSMYALIEVIHHWFLVMPILYELAKCTGWEFLEENNACLLDLDTLYSILLNLIYQTPQASQPLLNDL